MRSTVLLGTAALVAIGAWGLVPPQPAPPAASSTARSLHQRPVLRLGPKDHPPHPEPRPRLPRQLHSARYPLTVHWGAPTPESKARRLLQLAEEAWRVQVVEMGWPRPLPDRGRGGSDNLDLYLQALGEGQAYVAEDERPIGPYAVATCYIGFDRELPDDGTLASYVMHEFNHASQYALDANEGDAFFEHTAAFIDRLLMPDGPASRTGIADFQAEPHRALDSINGDEATDEYEYGAALFLQFISERYAGGSHEPALRLWQLGRQPDRSGGGDRNEPDWIDVLPQVLAGLQAPPVEDVLARFQVWRLQSALAQPSRLPLPALVHAGPLPNRFAPPLAKSPAPWGVNYLQFRQPAPGRLTVRLEPEAGRWALWLGVLGRDGAWGEATLTPPGPAPALSLTVRPGDDVYAMVLAYGDGDHDPDRQDWRPQPYRLRTAR